MLFRSERAILDPAPGRTAHEVALAIGVRMPHLSPALDAGAATFDAIYYGKRPADARTYDQMRTLDATAAATRPTTLSTSAQAVAS